MEPDSLTPDQAGALLAQLVSVFNGCVRLRNFRPYVDLFGGNAVLEFEGVPDYGPFEGKRAMEQRFTEDPPDDEIAVTRWKSDRGRIFITPYRNTIARLTTAFGGPSARWSA